MAGLTGRTDNRCPTTRTPWSFPWNSPHSCRKTRQSEVRTFGTMTVDLLALRDWLVAEGVTLVGMESTGVYWKPPFTTFSRTQWSAGC